MNYKIDERMGYILDHDKLIDPQQMCDILKNEIDPIVQNYLNLKEDIKVRFKKENNKNIFWVEINAERIKPFGYISR